MCHTALSKQIQEEERAYSPESESPGFKSRLSHTYCLHLKDAVVIPCHVKRCAHQVCVMVSGIYEALNVCWLLSSTTFHSPWPVFPEIFSEFIDVWGYSWSYFMIPLVSNWCTIFQYVPCEEVHVEWSPFLLCTLMKIKTKQWSRLLWMGFTCHQIHSCFNQNLAKLSCTVYRCKSSLFC